MPLSRPSAAKSRDPMKAQSDFAQALSGDPGSPAASGTGMKQNERSVIAPHRRVFPDTGL